ANKVLSPDHYDAFAAQPIDSLQSPVQPPPPVPDRSLLTLNDEPNDYLSDLSDVEDNAADITSNQNNKSNVDSNTTNGSARRRSSAFQMELLSGHYCRSLIAPCSIIDSPELSQLSELPMRIIQRFVAQDSNQVFIISAKVVLSIC